MRPCPHLCSHTCIHVCAPIYNVHARAHTRACVRSRPPPGAHYSVDYLGLRHTTVQLFPRAMVFRRRRERRPGPGSCPHGLTCVSGVLSPWQAFLELSTGPLGHPESMVRVLERSTGPLAHLRPFLGAAG